jgi:hypothetical protein
LAAAASSPKAERNTEQISIVHAGSTPANSTQRASITDFPVGKVGFDAFSLTLPVSAFYAR